jgi:hypothetical protein
MPTRSTPKLAYYWAAILLLPLIALWRRDDPLYSPLWQADPWFYLGYFRDLVSFKRDLFPGYYYGSRLSWILPGYLAHRVLPPLFANALLHLGTHTVATASLFRILRPTAGVRAAFLSAILFSAHPWFWCATGWDHVNGAAIAYLMLGMACLAVAAERPSRRWPLLLAGMSLTGAAAAHLLLAAFVPLALLYYAAMVWARRAPLKPALIRAALWLGAGFLAAIVPLSLVNGLLVDGNFWFWSPSFRTAANVVTNYAWAESIWRDHRLVPWLWLPIASAAVAAVSVCRWRRAVDRRDLAGLTVSAQLLLAFAFMAAMQLRGITLLGHYYYACYLFPFAFLAIGHSFWRAAENMPARTYALACAALLVLAAAAWYDPASHPAAGPAWLAAAFGALAASLAMQRRQAGVFLAIAGFGLLMFATYDGVCSSGRLHATRQEYLRVMAARQRIEKRRGDALILFWYDKREPAFQEYFALDASYMAEFSRISDTFPAGCPERVLPRNLVVVSSARADTAEIARGALSRCWSAIGLKAVVEDAFPGSQGPNPFAITLLGSGTDYAMQRPLHASFNSPAGKGLLRLAPDPTRDDALPLYMWASSPGAVQSVTSDGVEVRTPAGRYGYALTYPALDVPVTGRYRFVLRYSLRSGMFAFGAFPADESRWLASVVSRRYGEGPGEAAFSLDLKQGDTVILRVANNNFTDRPSSFLLEDAAVLLLPPAP